MKLSVITVNRNNVDGLANTISSVLLQDCASFEYIVIDGDSTDESTMVLSKMLNNVRNAKWISEPDSGIYNAMNKGAKMASGDYLLFLNSGDTFASKSVISDINSTNIRDDLIIGRINFIDAEGKSYKDFQNVKQKHSLYSFRESFFPHQATLIKKSTFFSVGPYEERYKIVADWHYCLTAILYHGCSYSTIPITIANFDNTGISSTNGTAMMAEIDKAFKDTLPSIIADDYIWASKHRGDISRIEWLDQHRIVRKLVNAIVLLGQRISK